MRSSIKWTLVFAAGMLAYHILFSHKPKSQPSLTILEPQNEAVAADSGPRKPAAVIPAPQFEAKIADLIKTEKLHMLNPQKPKQVIDLDLSESIISQMEYDWNYLPDQAEAHREDRGWRFTRISGDSSFYRAGFREGDLVTTEFMNNLRNSNAQLVIRVEQILNRITR